MMYWDYPGVTAVDRLQHLPPLNASGIRLSLLEAYGRLGLKIPTNQAFSHHILMEAGYRFRVGHEQKLVFADDGSVSLNCPPELALRLATDWSGQPPVLPEWHFSPTKINGRLSGAFRSLRPLYKFTWPNADEVYVSQQTGEVVQSTSRASRPGWPIWSYSSLAVLPLRSEKTGLMWTRVVVWTSGLATLRHLSD